MSENYSWYQSGKLMKFSFIIWYTHYIFKSFKLPKLPYKYSGLFILISIVVSCSKIHIFFIIRHKIMIFINYETSENSLSLSSYSRSEIRLSLLSKFAFFVICSWIISAVIPELQKFITNSLSVRFWWILSFWNPC